MSAGLERFYYSCDTYLSNLPYDQVSYQAYVSIVERYARPGDMILDIGCGNGTAAAMLAERGFRTQGVDLSSELAHECQRLRASGANYACANARFLPFASFSFDIVTSHDFIEHVTEVDAALDEMIRLTRRFLIIKSPNLLSPLKPAYNLALHLLGRAPRAYPITVSAREAMSLIISDFIILFTKRLIPSKRTFVTVCPS